MFSSPVMVSLLLLPLTAQREPSELCGAYCLYVALGSLDVQVPPFEEFRARLGEPEPRGYSLGQLAEFAEQHGAHTLGVKTNIDNLGRRPERFACIAHLTRGHFVLLSDVAGNSVKLIDPPRVSNVAPEALATQWDGTALLVAATPLLAEEDLPRDVPWWWWGLGGIAAAVGAAILCWWRTARA